MTIRHPELIAELITNAGWVDDADDLLSDIEGAEGKDAAAKKAQHVRNLMVDVNAMLAAQQRFGNSTHVQLDTSGVQSYIDDYLKDC